MTKEQVLDIAKCACDTIISELTPDKLPPANHFHYHQGVILDGMRKVYAVTKDRKYIDYIKGYYDNLIDEYGNFYFDRDQLDSLQVGILLFPLYEETKDESYLIAAKKLLHIIYGINRTTEGGFWHKDKYPYQMWLDGLYMASPFLLLCAKYFQQPELANEVIYQESLMRKHMYNKDTGLLYHAWDEKKAQEWANKESGCSNEIWGRSAGWYGVALVEILKGLPKNHNARADIEEKLAEYCKTLLKYQDEKSLCWYQIVDKGSEASNWLESSATALFLYTIIEAKNMGIISENEVSKEHLEKSFEGMITQFVTTSGNKFALTGICIGTSAGVYDYYIEREQCANDLHGVGAFLWAALALYESK